MGLPIAATAFVSWLPGIVLLTALSGAGEAALVIVYVSVRAAHSPDALVGRIASTARTITLALAPVGALIGGLLIDTIGGTMTLLVSGTGTCVIGLVFSRVDALHRASLAPSTSLRAREDAPAAHVLPIDEGIER
jgi:hypothetical protein